jgi:hypothetical protein
MFYGPLNHQAARARERLGEGDAMTTTTADVNTGQLDVLHEHFGRLASALRMWGLRGEEPGDGERQAAAAALAAVEDIRVAASVIAARVNHELRTAGCVPLDADERGGQGKIVQTAVDDAHAIQPRSTLTAGH